MELAKVSLCATISSMATSSPFSSSKLITDKLAALGSALGERENAHQEGLEEARCWAESLRSAVAAGIAAFERSAEAAGAPDFEIELTPVRIDDKHIRAVEFSLRRGRYRAIVTVKSRGDVTLVGPFHMGKKEGPCASFPFSNPPALESALADFLERFIEAAMTP